MKYLISCILHLHVSYQRGLPEHTKSSSLLAQLAIMDLLNGNLDLGTVSTSHDVITMKLGFKRLAGLATSKRYYVC